MTVISFPAISRLPDEAPADEPRPDPASAEVGERLRASPNFALAFSLDGHAYVAQEVEPYAQYWLTEPERVLLSLFSGRAGETAEGALAAYARLADRTIGPRELGRLRSLIGELRAAGVLVSARDDTSRYDAAMAPDYLRHRPFPPELAELIVRDGPVAEATRVLDMAGGPGSLALALAATSRHVALMDLSRGFITAAGREAARRGLPLELHHDSCNRLAAHPETYDVITISQALHWLDDVAVCRGVDRILCSGGSFFVMLSAMSLTDEHPLAYLLGDNSILGPKSPTPFPDQALALGRRLGLLFQALHAPQADAAAPIVPAGLSLFRQTRPFGLGYARAFMSPRHVEATGLDPRDFWADLDLRCAMANRRELLGVQDWAVLQFRRGGEPLAWPETAPPAAEIGWTGPQDD